MHSYSATEAEQAAARLLQQDILGFDTETRPSFRKEKSILRLFCS